MVGEPKVISIRHNLDSDNPNISKNLEKLLKKRRIAIHWGNSRVVNPEHYPHKKGRPDLRVLDKCCTHGAIVSADFSKLGKIIVGQIPKNKMRIMPKTFPGKTSRSKVVYKTVQLNHVRVFKRSDWSYLKLSTFQPRQRTIRDYTEKLEETPYARAARERIMAIFKGQNHLEDNVNSLIPAELEVLCYEYLKAKNKLDVLLLPIGRGLRDVDIYGLKVHGKNKYVFAQVTFCNDKDIKDKLDRLKTFKKGHSIRFFFGPETVPKEVKNDAKANGIKYVTNEKVFETLNNSSKRKYRRLICEMLRVT